MKGKLIIFSAPSGTGKSTIINWLMQNHKELNMAFSISCTSRAPRGTEQNGVEYFFLTPEEKQCDAGQNVVFDVDVKGGCNIKKHYGSKAISIFIMPPSIEELRRRLESRATDAPGVIDQRIARAEFEIGFADKFDKVVVNDNLDKAKNEVLEIINDFLTPNP